MLTSGLGLDSRYRGSVLITEGLGLRTPFAAVVIQLLGLAQTTAMLQGAAESQAVLQGLTQSQFALLAQLIATADLTGLTDVVDELVGATTVTPRSPDVVFGSSMLYYARSEGTPLGPTITNWADFVGSRIWSQPITAFKPGVIAGSDGNPLVLSDNNNDRMQLTGNAAPDDTITFPASTPFGLVMLVRMPNSFSSPPLYFVHDSGNLEGISTDNFISSGNIQLYDGFTQVVLAPNATIATKSEYLIEIYRDSSDDLSCFVNGVDVTPAGPPNMSSALVFDHIMGSINYGAAAGPSFYEHYALSRKATASERNEVLAWYLNRWPTAFGLPATARPGPTLQGRVDPPLTL